MRNPWLVVLFCCFSFSVFGQSPGTPIQQGAINLLYLDQLVKEGVDSVRKENGLLPLRNDSVLFVAAQDHADYLSSRKILSHFEDDIPQKNAPADRVHFHGGNDFNRVGENVQANYVLTPVTVKYEPHGSPPRIYQTYGQLAFGIVDGWVHSPPHYRNMLTPEYEFTGVAVAYDPSDNSVRAVQVFGSRPYFTNAKPDSAFFPYSNYVPPPTITGFDQVSHTPHSDIHAWKLRAPEDSAKTCPDCWQSEFSPGTTRIEVKNGKAIFYTEETEIMKKLLNNKTDGLAIEIVSYKNYDCGNPKYYTKASRRNGQCIFSGMVLKPLYRKRLKHGFKKKNHHSFHERLARAKARSKDCHGIRSRLQVLHDEFYYPFESEYFTYPLGKIPPDVLDGYYEVNVVVIQKKQVCRVLHFTSFCGEDWNAESMPVDVVRFSPDTFCLETKTRNYNFTIPFQQGQVVYSEKDIKPFLDSLSSSPFIVDSVWVDAFASVEGSAELNVKLANARARSIVSVIQGGQKDSIGMQICSSENWPLFEKQVKTVAPLSVFNGKTHEQVKAMLTGDTALARNAEPWLARERSAHVRLKVRVPYYPQDNCEWLMIYFENYADSADTAKHRDLRPFFLDSLSDLHAWYYRELLNGKGDTSCIRKISFPRKKEFDTLNYNQAWLKRKFLVHKDSVEADREFFRSCNLIMSGNRVPYWPAVYGMTSLDVKYWKTADCWSGNPERTLLWIQWLKEEVPDSMEPVVEQLELSWHYKAVVYYEAKGKAKRPQVVRSLSAIAGYWSDSTRMNDSIALLLCNYLILHKEINWGYAVLWPYALKPEPRHDVLMQFLKLSYQHIEESTDFPAYYQLVAWSQTYLTHDEWCSIFVGPCNISFQLWDSEGMRNLYCEKCAGWKNYARDPEKWKAGK